MTARDYVLILSCPDQRGIVATVTQLLFERGANIEESQQFDDVRTDQFFMRIRFSVPEGGPELERWSGRSGTRRRSTGP